MKEIILELKDFIKKDFNIYTYSYTILFLAVSVFLNYKFRFEDTIIDPNFGSNIGMFIYFIYFLSPYLLVLIPILAIKKKLYILKKREFWIKVIVFFGIFGIMSGFYFHRELIREFQGNNATLYYLYKVIGNLKRIIPFLSIFFILKLIYDKKDNHLYGLRYKGINYKPFLWMLLLMIPLIVIASFQPAFQRSYPQFRFWIYDSALGLNQFEMGISFYIAYALDFVSIELLFRGALIIGMAKLLGRDAILPMAAAYVIIHFGKPPGEAISAFFGGFILGVHSLEKKNIFGGIIIHVGIAYLMDFAAILQYFYGK